MAAVHGSGTYLSVNSVDVSAYADASDLTETTATADTTTYGAEANTFIVGLDNSTLTFGGVFDAAFATTLNAAKRALVPFVWGPEGNTAGDTRKSGTCILTTVGTSAPVGDKVAITATAQVTGPVTTDTF